MAERASRLPETLTALMADRGYLRNRQPIIDAVGISAAALSQYARGVTTPSLQKAMALADFFEVTLDELVYGTPSLGAAAPQDAVLRTVADAVSRTQAMTAAHTALVARIARQLGDRIATAIDESADRAVQESRIGGEVVEGLITDGELVRLEARARRVDVVTIDLDANVLAMPDGETAAGSFLDVVTFALQRGCSYRFVVSSEPRTTDRAIRGFLDLIEARVDPQVIAQRCQLRRATLPTLVGMGLYHLDVDALRVEDPAIYNQFSSAVDDDGWFGYLIRPQPAAGKDSVMQSRRRDTARALFDTLWLTGEPVR